MTVLIKPFDKDFLSVSFPDFFNTELLNAVRSLPDRKWNNEERVWLVPQNQKSIDLLLENIYETNLFNVDDGDRIGDENESKTPENTSAADSELDILTTALKVRHYSDNTISRYRKWVQIFLDSNKKIGANTENKAINDFLKNLALKKKRKRVDSKPSSCRSSFLLPFRKRHSR